MYIEWYIWIQRASKAGLWYFAWCWPEQDVERRVGKWRRNGGHMISHYRHVSFTWWRHQMEIFSALLAICAGNSPVPSEFLAQRPVKWSFDVFFDLRLNNVTVMLYTRLRVVNGTEISTASSVFPSFVFNKNGNHSFTNLLVSAKFGLIYRANVIP